MEIHPWIDVRCAKTRSAGQAKVGPFPENRYRWKFGTIRNNGLADNAVTTDTRRRE